MKNSLTTKYLSWLPCLFMIYVLSGYRTFSQKPAWKHFYIDKSLPGSSYGTGGPVAGDFDHDGDLDVAVSRRNTLEAYWYQRVNDSIWIPHVMGKWDYASDALGSVSIDVNHDGWLDVMFEGVWFENPANLDKNPETPWKSHYINAAGHDAIAADMEGNGVEDIVTYDGSKLAWYNTSKPMWEWENIIDYGYHDLSGIFPHGFGDLDGDGDPDVVIPQFWFENPGNSTDRWIRHEWPFNPIPNASYGRSIRSWIADINHDGKNDIVYSNSDTGGCHLYWVENKGNGKSWESHQLSDPPVRAGDVAGTGSFHSLGVADFDQDGNLDIFAGEQEDPDQMYGNLMPMKPKGLKERGVIWYNAGGKNPEFETYVIHVDNPGWHDAKLVDIDGDGDLDIISAIWNADGPDYPLDYWRNEFKKK